MKRVLLALLLLLPAILSADTPSQVDFLIGGLTDSSGQPLAGGKVYTYSAGTTSPKTTWQDSGKVTPQANPVILDAQGKKLVFADGAYKFRIDDANDVTQYTLDNLQFAKYSGSATYAGATTGSSNAYVATLSPALLSLANGAKITFEANHTNTGAATLNVNGLGAIELAHANDTPFAANEVVSGNTYTAVYEASTNAWLVENPQVPVWTSWTPTLSASGSMTYTSTSITYAKYIQIGKLVYFKVFFTGTVGGTPSNGLNFTIPVTANADGVTGAVRVRDNGASAGGILFSNSTTQLGVSRYNVASYTAGAVDVNVYGFYEAA